MCFGAGRLYRDGVGGVGVGLSTQVSNIWLDVEVRTVACASCTWALGACKRLVTRTIMRRTLGSTAVCSVFVR